VLLLHTDQSHQPRSRCCNARSQTRSEPKTCYCCGEELSDDNLAWDFLYPDDLAEQFESEQPDPVIDYESRTVIVSDVGSFMRAILPIRLEGGLTATLGVWLAFTSEEEFERTMAAGRAGGNTWKSLTFSGVLVNRVEPWPDVYGAKATATVLAEKGPNGAPYVSGTTQPLLAEVLAQEWPHHPFLGARRGPRHD
ncbi:DUF2199 domain-containing protein, partial [Streptosporangium sp. LJ11]|uniref:DUF2199 domain-containing protein n=1 Tax=Streptosporangium sp. LJ11 TaxID=3436927 RepID=UPI003F795224